MTTLPDRLEEAEAGSRELDYAIKHWLETNTDDGYWKMRVAADWTTSLDAALALAERVLPGWWIELAQKWSDDEHPNMRWMAEVSAPEPVVVCAYGEVLTSREFYNVYSYAPALALCAAILRAAPAMKGDG